MIRLTGMNSGLDTDSMVKDLVAAYEKKGQKTKNNKTKAEWKQTIWTDLNKKIKSFNSKVKSMQYTTNYSQKKTVSSDENRVSVIAGDSAVKGTQTIKVKALAKTSYITSGELSKVEAIKDEGGNITGYRPTGEKLTSSSTLGDLGISSTDGKIYINQNGKPVAISANKNTTIGGFVEALKAAGVDASFDEKNGRLFISAKDSGEAANITFTGDSDAISKLKLTSASGASVIAGQDAEIELNGATFKSNTNSFNINGMAITVKGLTAKGTKADGSDDETLTLTTDTDTDTIYKNIKSLISEYSKLMNELTKLYNAPTAKKYDPLTDEEKDAMTDDEIEKWETRIKDSLLRRDSNVASVMNAMKAAAVDSYTVNGTKMSLVDFGVETLGYFDSAENEKSALHINGDEDDDAVSGRTNTLKQMVTADPDGVAEFFSKFMTNLSEQFNKLTSSNTNRSYGNFYDDKKVKEEMTSYEKKVSDFETYLNGIEDKYYKQFTAMEKAMAKLNSTQTSLSNYFGQ